MTQDFTVLQEPWKVILVAAGTISLFFFWNDLESWMNVMAHMKCNKYVRTLLQTMEEGIRRLGEVGMLKWTII